jgi:hypothetical protein
MIFSSEKESISSTEGSEEPARPDGGDDFLSHCSSLSIATILETP